MSPTITRAHKMHCDLPQYAESPTDSETHAYLSPPTWPIVSPQQRIAVLASESAGSGKSCIQRRSFSELCRDWLSLSLYQYRQLSIVVECLHVYLDHSRSWHGDVRPLVVFQKSLRNGPQQVIESEHQRVDLVPFENHLFAETSEAARAAANGLV